MVAKGQSTKAISVQLGISPRTVDNHIENAADKIAGLSKPRYRITIWFVSIKSQDAA